MTTPRRLPPLPLPPLPVMESSARDEAHALRCQLEYRSLYGGSSEAAMGELFDRLLLLLRDQGVQGLIASALPRLNRSQQQSALVAHLVHADRKIAVERATSWISSRGKCRCRERSPHGGGSN